MIPLAAVIAGAVLAGCGGDDSSDTTAGATGATGAQGAALSKSEFLAQGNAVCQTGDKEIDAAASDVFSQGQAPSQAAQEKFVTDTVVPNIQGQIDGLDALSPPSGDEDQVQAIIDAAQSALDKVEADPSLITQQGQSDPFAEANQLADDYGLDKCGSDSG
jgi:hypothetical protein